MKVNKLFTLVFLKKNNSVLLGLKRRGLGQNLWNGFGGKVEKNESIVDCAKREVLEECNLVAKELKQVGVVRYELLHKNYTDVVHIFTCEHFEGLEKASEEMDPVKWYEIDNIPYHEMWPDAAKWHPYMLSGRYFSARIVYSDDQSIKTCLLDEHEDLNHVLK